MGLDRDDTVVRRRLRQKLEFLAEDAADQAAPTDAELQDWLARHPETFHSETRVSLRQVYLSAERRGAAIRRDAERLLVRLRAAGPRAPHDEFGGDPSLLPIELPLAPISEVARTFGEPFARAVEALDPQRWSGPIESPFGLHLVLVAERMALAPPTLAEVRPLIEREFMAERRKAQLQNLYERLLRKYTVTTEPPAPGGDPAKPAPAGTGGR
jgi:hypothetical protein